MQKPLVAAAVCMCAVIPAIPQFIGRRPSPIEIEQYCLKAERIRPNLETSTTLKLKGRITDIGGAPFKNSVVELRRYISEAKQVSLEEVTTDADGNFEIAAVPKGKFRLLASPTRAFQQPRKLNCPGGDECYVSIKLQVNVTDQPIEICPVR